MCIRDRWESIRDGQQSLRKEIVHQANNQYSNGSCTAADVANPYVPSCGSSMTRWPFKLIHGFGGDGRHVPLPPQEAPTPLDPRPCIETPCLFNLEQDPTEANDLGGSEPLIVEMMMKRLKELSVPMCEPQPADSLTPQPSDVECAVVNEHKAYLPFLPDPVML
eukprot:TRINITY_DN11785_c0_g1_i2.p1 TRINITY_DN11785_c0_g1~~TRINITY_DN11785_c0_g1_i2.p1  ORF type:complete len:164 (-),score=42.32 TRINITY_DN11785_c0_g1_i2:207-698(-)